MRQRIILANSPAVHDLYRCFRGSQGALYHYTAPDTADSISTNWELWLTRADSFLDQTEIEYGTEILRSAIKLEVEGDKKEQVLSLIGSLSDSLRKCYVFSVSSNPSSAHLACEYGPAILELNENFSLHLSHLAWHSIPVGDGFGSHPFINIYEVIEGYVVYEPAEQLRIACKAIALVQELSHGSPDVFHVRQLLSTCITLFKHENYKQEEEYRIVLHRLSNTNAPNFDEQRDNNGRTITYIKAQIAQFKPDCLISIRPAEGYP